MANMHKKQRRQENIVVMASRCFECIGFLCIALVLPGLRKKVMVLIIHQCSFATGWNNHFANPLSDIRCVICMDVVYILCVYTGAMHSY